MGYSKLCSSIVPAAADNYSKGRSGYKICKFTPHHMAGVLTGEQCARLFQNSSRNASANYCIGNDGRIVGCVDEDNRAWTSSSKSNDCQAITVEVSNSKTGGNWPISEAAWNSLVDLAVDVCTRHGFRLVYDGTANGSLTRHNMFAATACPGKYLQSKFEELARVVNERLDKANEEPEVKPVPAPTTKHKVGETVTINGVYTSSNSTTKLTPLRNSGKITKIVAGALNPYLLDNGNLGWVNDKCIVETKKEEPKPAKKSVHELAEEVIAGKWGSGADRKNRLTAAGYDYDAVQDEVNRILLGGNNQPTKKPTTTNTTIKVGDKVKVTKAVAYNGVSLSSSVLKNTYDVIEVKGDRVVIGKGRAVTAAVNKANLKKV